MYRAPTSPLQTYYPELLFPTKERKDRQRTSGGKFKAQKARGKMNQDGKGGRCADYGGQPGMGMGAAQDGPVEGRRAGAEDRGGRAWGWVEQGAGCMPEGGARCITVVKRDGLRLGAEGTCDC